MTNLERITGQLFSYREDVDDGFYVVCRACHHTRKLHGDILSPYKYPEGYTAETGFGSCRKCTAAPNEPIFAVHSRRIVYVIINRELKVAVEELERQDPAFCRAMRGPLLPKMDLQPNQSAQDSGETASGEITDYNDSPERTEFVEGDSLEVTLTDHERDPRARRKCIEFFGAECKICGFSFGKKYGVLGEGFIHVHHIDPLSSTVGPRITNATTDLIPVCPNCHAMLHKYSPPLSPEALREIIADADQARN